MEFGLIYCDSAGLCFNHYSTRTPRSRWFRVDLGAMAQKWVLHILQSSSITGALPSGRLISYPGHSFDVGGGLTFLQKCSRCILWPQPSGPGCKSDEQHSTLCELHPGFTSMVCSTASESAVLGWPDIAWSSKFFQLEKKFFSHLVTVLCSIASLPFMQQMILVVSVVLLVSSNLQSKSSRIRLRCTFIFQIIHRVKKCTTWQRTNYYDTNNQSGDPSQLELLWSRDVRDVN